MEGSSRRQGFQCSQGPVQCPCPSSSSAPWGEWGHGLLWDNGKVMQSQHWTGEAVDLGMEDWRGGHLSSQEQEWAQPRVEEARHVGP